MSRSNLLSDAALDAAAPIRPRHKLPPEWRRVCVLIALTALLAAFTWHRFWQQPREQRRLAYLHAARGAEQADRGDLAAAISEYQAATRLDPANGSAWYLLGVTQRRQNAQQGLPALRKAATLSPLDAGFQREYGSALLDQDQAEEARVVLASAVSLAPTDTHARLELARAYLRRVTGPADLEHAVTELTTALRLEPGNVDARCRLGRALYQADRLKEARSEFEQSLELLSAGARGVNGKFDGRSHSSVMWFSLAKGARYYLQQIARRTGHPAEAAAHEQITARMQQYVRETDPLFLALRANPRDRKALAQLAAVYARFGFPADGPDGAAAAQAWIPK